MADRPYFESDLRRPDEFVQAFFARRTTRKAREIVVRRLIATVEDMRRQRDAGDREEYRGGRCASDGTRYGGDDNCA